MPGFAQVQRIFDDWRLTNHVPGLVYGIVANGEVVSAHRMGVQDLRSNRTVTPDTLFRIASMSNAFTALAILKLRDDGKVTLEAPAEDYVPQMRRWFHPFSDSLLDEIVAAPLAENMLIDCDRST
ncbi:MAG: beta-lactamase family protein [Kineosporiaceae bacterium]|nr:beta-lactamase family protein [Aeromicrobium sp.]